MQIIPIDFPTEAQRQEIIALAAVCSTHDTIPYTVEFDESFRREGQYNTFILREDHMALAVINLFTPTDTEGELSAFTHPDHRRRGYFSLLLEAAQQELKRRDCKRLLFVIPKQSESGRAAAEHAGAVFEFSEYLMRLEDDLRKDPVPVSPVEIRRAEGPDEPDLLILAGISFGDSPEDGARYLEGTFGVPGRSLSVAVLDGRPIAMASMVTSEDRCYIHGLCVLPAYRKRGIGRALLEYKIAEAANEYPGRPIELEVAVQNPGALSLYTRTGFMVIERYDYYQMTL